jgi:hypothetical protein
MLVVLLDVPNAPFFLLVMVFGDGRVVGYDLDQTMESSSALLFLREKFPAVIGTCPLSFSKERGGGG